MIHSSPGKLIIFEGTDGTGKSTQIQLLADYLKQNNYPVIVTREPTDSQYGKRIRALYSNREEVSRREELQLFIDDRKEHVETLLLPELELGKIVLCDRYFLSTVAYQGAIGFDPEEIYKLNSFAPEPDIALLFELPPEKSVERITASRGDMLNDFEQVDSLMKVRAIFDKMDYPYIQRVNADQPIEIIQNQVIDYIQPLLKSIK